MKEPKREVFAEDWFILENMCMQGTCRKNATENGFG